MLTTAGVLVLFGIFALAGLLLMLPVILRGRGAADRDQRPDEQ